jgi:hypothetical protein
VLGKVVVCCSQAPWVELCVAAANSTQGAVVLQLLLQARLRSGLGREERGPRHFVGAAAGCGQSDSSSVQHAAKLRVPHDPNTTRPACV